MKKISELYRTFECIIAAEDNVVLDFTNSQHPSEQKILPKKRRKLNFTPRHRTITEEMICDSVGDIPEQNFMKMNIYESF